MSTVGSPANEDRRGRGRATDAPVRLAIGSAALAGASVLLAPGIAAAATITVNSPSGAAADGVCGPAPGTCSLADAIQQANSASSPGADQIVFTSSVTGSINLAAELPNVSEDLSVTGPGATNLRVDGQGLPIFNVDGTNSLGIDGLELYGGYDHRRGAAIDAPFGSVSVNASSFTYNYVEGDTYVGTFAAGGAIYSNDVTVTDSSFIGNTAAASGGEGRGALGGAIGGNTGGSSTLTIDGSTFDSNQSAGEVGRNASYGGAVGGSGEIKITNSTFFENMAISNGATGGGIFLRNSDVVIRNSTITENSASGTGGGIFVSSGVSIYLSNSIVAGNTIGGGTGPDIRTPVSAVNGGYSLIGNTNGATISGTTNITGVDPGLGPLADNGGPTQTRAITTASPAYNAGGGTFAPADQRGILRPQGGQGDIGAFEIDVAPSVRIDSAPSGAISDSTPEISFSSPDPDIARFECRIDDGAFATCASPYTTPELPVGGHTVTIRAVDAAGLVSLPVGATFTVTAPDPTPVDDSPVDDSILAPKVSAAKKQKVGGKVVVIKVKAGAGEPVDLVGKGRIVVKGKRGGKKSASAAAKSFRLKKVKKSTAARKRTVLKLKPQKKKKDSKKIFKLLRRGKNLRADVTVKLSDAAGNSAVEKRAVRLRLKRK